MLKVEFSYKADLNFMEERSTGAYYMLITSVQLWPHCPPRPAAGGWDVLCVTIPGPSQAAALQGTALAAAALLPLALTPRHQGPVGVFLGAPCPAPLSAAQPWHL